MRIFIAAMPGAGNLGDDLISTILVDKILSKYANSTVGVLTNEEDNLFGYHQNKQVVLFKKPRRKDFQLYIRRNREIKEFLKTTEVLIIGGGGLFQDSHYSFTVHNYYKYAALVPSDCKIVGLGLGIGPIKGRLTDLYFGSILNNFNHLQVRDYDSFIGYLDSFENTKEVCCDIVLGSNIEKWIKSKDKRKHVLGCSIRPWQGLSIASVEKLINKAIQDQNFNSVELYVFEYTTDNIEEYSFAVALQKSLMANDIKTKILCYNKEPLNTFMDHFCTVEGAIAVRYHANILWQKIRIPVIPISYAPKVTSLYTEQGKSVLEINDLTESNLLSFQTLDLDYSYSIPDLDKLIINGPRKSYLVSIFNVLEFTYGIYRSLRIRIKK